MSHSKPRDLCWQCKVQWEQERYGEEYMITGRDMKEAKEFLEACGEMPNPDSVVTHVKAFCKSDFGAWKTLNYPLWALFRNWNTYNQKEKKPQPQERRVVEFCDEHSKPKPCGDCAREIEELKKQYPGKTMQQIALIKLDEIGGQFSP